MVLPLFVFAICICSLDFSIIQRWKVWGVIGPIVPLSMYCLYVLMYVNYVNSYVFPPCIKCIVKSL